MTINDVIERAVAETRHSDSPKEMGWEETVQDVARRACRRAVKEALEWAAQHAANNLFSDEMDTAVAAQFGARYAIIKNAERLGEKAEGEKVARTALAAAFDSYCHALAATLDKGDQ